MGFNISLITYVFLGRNFFVFDALNINLKKPRWDGSLIGLHRIDKNVWKLRIIFMDFKG